MILCEPYAVAQEICKFLSEHGIELAVHKSIYRINQIYGMYGSDLGTYSLLHKRLREKKVQNDRQYAPRTGDLFLRGPYFLYRGITRTTFVAWTASRRPVAERFL